MPLTVNAADAPGAVSATMVAQKFGLTSTGPTIGTSMLMDCMGIVIHNPTRRVGAVLHVEARERGAYLPDILKALNLVAGKLSRMGAAGGMQVVLMGNQAGIGDQRNEDSLGNMIKDALDVWQVGDADIMDLRNHRGAHIGTWAPTVRGRFTACVYDPTAESLVVNAIGGFASSHAGRGVEEFGIQ